MKAWRVYDINDMRLEDVPIPKARPGWLLARVKTFQPSITEIQRFQGVSQRGLSEMKEIIRANGPISMGHEVCAVVEDIVDKCDIKKGDRIAYYHYPGMVAGTHYSGCEAEYYLLPLHSVFKMDASIPDIEGPALQPLSDCVSLVREINPKLGEMVAVFGQGVMGMNVTQLLHLSGAKVIGIDVREQCLKIAAELGADIAINAIKHDPVKAIMDVTNGIGVDVAIDCASGSPEVGLSGDKTFFDAIQAVRKSGRVIQVAFFNDTVTFDPNLLRSKYIKYIFPEQASRDNMEIGARLVAQGKVHIKPLITHILQGLEKLPEALEITAHKAQHNAINPAVVVVST